MKLACENKYIETYGESESNSFSIKASAKAFKILSDGLYSDKIMAVVRELCCNAYDSHVAAKNLDQPYQVQLPSPLEPQFKIRDFGTGLSHEDVMKLYTTYFESTKSDTNDYIGALGLGSKSPFSYVDQFMVESWYDGVHRTYSAFIGQDGSPKINLMGEKESDEHNGIQITVAVKDSDINKFKKKLKVVHSFTEMKPTVLGIQDFKFDNIEITHGSKELGWIFYKQNYTSYNCVAIQGGVAYPISKNKISDYNYNSPDYEEILDSNIVLFFEMGELDVAASREEISYDPQTIKNIKKKAEEVYSSILKTYYSEVDKQPNRQAAYEVAKDTYKTSPYSIQSLLKYSFTYKGQTYKFNGGYMITPPKDKVFSLVQTYQYYRGGNYNFSAKTERVLRDTDSYEVKYFYSGVIIDDVKGVAYIKRIREAYEEGILEKGYYLVIPNDGLNVQKYINKHLGGMKIVGSISSFPNKKVVKKKTTYSDVNIKEWTPQRYYTNFETVDYQQEVLRRGGFYVETFKGSLVDDTIREKYILCKDLLDIGEVYAVAKVYSKKMKEFKNWVNLSEYLDKAIPVLLDNADLKVPENLLLERNLTSSQKSALMKIKDLTSKNKSVTILTKLIKDKTDDEKFKRISSLHHYINNKDNTVVPLDTREKEVIQTIKDVFDKAELVNYIDYYSASGQDVLNYLELVNGE